MRMRTLAVLVVSLRALPALPATTDNGAMRAVETVRFDERENPTTTVPSPIIERPPFEFTLPAAATVPSDADVFPPLESGDVGGWMYFNLARPVDGTLNPVPNQAWVVTTMAAEGRYGVAFDATALGNGCTPPVGVTGDTPIGPAHN